jgi:hypothetical protein
MKLYHIKLDLNSAEVVEMLDQLVNEANHISEEPGEIPCMARHQVHSKLETKLMLPPRTKLY